MLILFVESLWIVMYFYPFNILGLGLVADPVIEAIARLEFEDGLRTGVLPGGCWGP